MILLAILALLVFGPEGLPSVAKNVAQTVRALRRAGEDFRHEVRTALDEEQRERDIAARQRKRSDDGDENAEIAQLPPPDLDSEEESGEVQLTGIDEEWDREPPPEPAELIEDEDESEVENSEAEDEVATEPEEVKAASESEPEPEVETASESESESIEDDEEDDDDEGPAVPMNTIEKSGTKAS